MMNCFFVYLTRSLNKRIPLDSGKEATKKVGIDIGLAQSELYIAELERKVVRRTAFGVAGEEVVCDKTDHREGLSEMKDERQLRRA